MKKLLIILAILITANVTSAQTLTVGPAEKKITDSLCNCMTGLNLSKITTKTEANSAFTECFSKQSNLLLAVAQERQVDVVDGEAMRKVGIQIGKNLLAQNCSAFLALSSKMASAGKDGIESTLGTFKRIDLKGFNYLVIATEAGNEKSFLWLRQFSESEKFINTPASLVGKKVKVSSQEIEVYLPQANGYYKVKEITAVDILQQ